jgi:hypothetical protein
MSSSATFFTLFAIAILLLYIASKKQTGASRSR